MSKAKMITVGAVCVAMAFLLNQVTIFRMPMGGSVTPFSMAFIALAGYWLGPLYGIVAGVAMGLLDLTTGFVNYHPAQVLLDYPLAFGMIGIAGFFKKWKFGLQIGYVAGVLGRFAMVFLSGFIFFYMYAPEGQHAALYSAIYNLNYILPEMIASLVIMSLPAMKHAIDTVTKNTVSPADYAFITEKNKGSVSAGAKIVTGAVIGALGGFAFVLTAYIRRLENLSISQVVTDAALFLDAPRADRLYRMVDRNTEQLFTLQTVGVIFFAVSAALLISSIIPKYTEK